MPPVLAVCWMLGATGGTLAAASVLSPVHLVLVHDTRFHFYGFSHSDCRYLVLYPLSCVMTLSILARATCLCFTHRVTWRGTHYRLRPHLHPAVEKAGLPPHAELMHR